MVMKKMSRAESMVFSMGLFVVLLVVDVGAATIAEKCSNDFTKVQMCLSYATGKAATPSKECCSSVTEIKASEPECLCYIIQQAHNGSQSIKSLGIQESRLLQLPSACQLANASVSDCPKLLNIPSSSPDYAIFTNSSSSTSPNTVIGTASPATAGTSSGTKNVPQLAAGLIAIAMAIFFCVPPVEAMSTFYT